MLSKTYVGFALSGSPIWPFGAYVISTSQTISLKLFLSQCVLQVNYQLQNFTSEAMEAQKLIL